MTSDSNSSTKPRPKSHRLLFWSLGLLLLLALPYLIYLAGANLILKTSILDSVINRKPEKLQIEWQDGWSVIPGVIHVEGLDVRGQTRKMRWQCRVGEGTYHISLLGLLGKDVRISHGRGRDFAYYVRRRSGPKEKDHAPHLPDIEGFAETAQADPKRREPPKNPWVLDISDIRFDGRIDLWIHRFRVLGDGRVGGGVHHEIRDTLEVPHALLELDQGEVQLDSKLLARQVDVHVDAGLKPFVPRDTRGTEILEFLHGEIAFRDGVIPDVGVFNDFLPQKSTIRLDAGTGRASLSMSASASGEATGELEAAFEGIDASMAGRKLRTNLELQTALQKGDMVRGVFDVTGHLTLNGTVVRATKADEASEPWWGRLDIEQGRVDLGWPAEVALRTAVTMQDVRPILALFAAKAAHEKKKPPVWVRLAPGVQDVSGHGRLAVSRQGFVLENGELTGDKMDLMTRMRSRPGGIDGQLYLHYGVFHLGIDFHGGEKDFKLTEPKKWYLEQPEFEASIGNV